MSADNNEALVKLATAILKMQDDLKALHTLFLDNITFFKGMETNAFVTAAGFVEAAKMSISPTLGLFLLRLVLLALPQQRHQGIS